MAPIWLLDIFSYHVYSLRYHFVYASSQWETALQSNVVSHWLGAFTKWSRHCGLVMPYVVSHPSWPTLHQVMTWHLFSAKQLYGPILTYFQMKPQAQTVCKLDVNMITSSNASIFSVTGPCVGNELFTGVFPSQRPMMRSFIFFIFMLGQVVE